MFRKIRNYFEEDLWNCSLEGKKGFYFFWMKVLRIFSLALTRFFQKTSIWCSSLTYLTLMALVPILALSIFIANAVGFQDKFQDQLLNQFPEQRFAFETLFEFARAYLNQAKGGIIAIFGLGLLFFSVLFMLRALERALNDIWGFETSRSWMKAMRDYFLYLLILPLFFLFVNSALIYVMGYIRFIIRQIALNESIAAFLVFLFSFISYAFFWLIFSLTYFFMPNGKVRFRSCSMGALVAALLYIVAQGVYLFFQTGASRYGAIYGTMAALPLFLAWIQLSWYLILFGAEMAHAHQSVTEYEFFGQVKGISPHFEKTLLLWLISEGIRQKRFSFSFLTEKLLIPNRLAKKLIKKLLECEILQEEKGEYVLQPKVEEMRVNELLVILEKRGCSHFGSMDPKLFAPFEKLLERFEKTIETSSENTKIKDVSNTI